MGTESAFSVGANSSWRHLTKLMLGGIAVVVLSAGALFSGPASAQAEEPSGTTQVTADVSVAPYELSRVDDSGKVIDTKAPGPGSTFFASYRISNTSAEPVTVVGFESNFFVEMHANRQGDLPDDYCMQFFETRDFDDRQSYPQVVESGEELIIHDNTTHHYLHTPDNPSNECQQSSFSFGAPIFQTLETVTAQEPEWREATCDTSAAVIIPDVRGVQYALDGEPVEADTHEVAVDAQATVTASAEENFEFSDEAIVEWAHAFTAPTCDDEGGTGEDGNTDGADVSSRTSGDDTVVATSATSSEDTAVSALPATGGNASPLPWIAGLGTLLLGAALLARRLITAHPTGR